MPGLKTYIGSKYPTLYSFLGIAKQSAKQWKTKQSAKIQHKEKFSKIYTRNAWGGAESRSGTGSSFEQTETVREQLPILLETLGVKSFLDAPCGDLHWLKEVDLGIETYVGVDVVADSIRRNRKLYGNPKRTFLVRDLTRDKLPKVDLIFCRDCLGHFSFKDIHAVIRNFKRTHSTYLLTTTFPKLNRCVDIQTGSWRPLNLQLAPFFFPEPLKLIIENCTEENSRYTDKSVGLWRISDIPRQGALWEWLNRSSRIHLLER